MTAEDISRQFGGTFDLNGNRIDNIEQWILDQIEEQRKSYNEE